MSTLPEKQKSNKTKQQKNFSFEMLLTEWILFRNFCMTKDSRNYNAIIKSILKNDDPSNK